MNGIDKLPSILTPSSPVSKTMVSTVPANFDAFTWLILCIIEGFIFNFYKSSSMTSYFMKWIGETHFKTNIKFKDRFTMGICRRLLTFAFKFSKGAKNCTTIEQMSEGGRSSNQFSNHLWYVLQKEALGWKMTFSISDKQKINREQWKLMNFESGISLCSFILWVTFYNPVLLLIKLPSDHHFQFKFQYLKFKL